MTRTRTYMTLLVLLMAASAQAATITGLSIPATNGASGSIAGLVPGNAVDGYTNTIWYSQKIDDGVSNPWITVDLGDTYTVGDVTMTAVAQDYRKFSKAEVSVSLNNTTFTTVGTFDIGVGALEATVFNLGNVDARYVRFEAVEAYYVNWDGGYLTSAEQYTLDEEEYMASVAELSFDAVPEPMTMSLLAVGGLALLKRRRK